MMKPRMNKWWNMMNPTRHDLLMSIPFYQGLVNVPFWGFVSHHQTKYLLEMKYSLFSWVMWNRTGHLPTPVPTKKLSQVPAQFPEASRPGCIGRSATGLLSSADGSCWWSPWSKYLHVMVIKCEYNMYTTHIIIHIYIHIHIYIYTHYMYTLVSL